MKIIPKYPKNILSSPYHFGIVIGFFIGTGFSIIAFNDNLFTNIYGLVLLCIAIYYYYKNYKLVV